MFGHPFILASVHIDYAPTFSITISSVVAVKLKSRKNGAARRAYG
jgi:hypothetical protein